MIDRATIEFMVEAANRPGDDWIIDQKARLKDARANLIELTAQVAAVASAVDGRIALASPDPRKCLNSALIKTGVGAISFPVSPMKNAAATYFVRISPHQSYAGGGARLPPPRLARILRQTIASHTGKWRSIVEGPVFGKYFPAGLTAGHAEAPAQYGKNHDALDFFNLKNFGACRSLDHDLLMSPHVVQEIVMTFAASRALVDYINRATARLA